MVCLSWLTQDRESPLARSTRGVCRRTRAGRDRRPGAGYTLIGAIMLLGGIGYAIDAWRGTSPWFLLGGLLLGIVVGLYELAKTVFVKK